MTAKLRVAILGSTGMLGSMVLRHLSTLPDYDLSTIDRPSFDAEAPFLQPILTDFLRGHDYAINCIGIIKPRIDEGSAVSVERAIRVNSLFPHALARAAESVGCRVLQIATDCVFSRREGNYAETAPHDPLDVYGKTKSLGEVRSPLVHHLRCSVIGPEPPRTKSRHHDPRPHQSLLGWFLSHPTGSTVQGYTNHLWNGVTTLAFAKICHGIMREGIELPQMQHVVPANVVAKDKLLRHFAYYYGRSDMRVAPIAVADRIDRTLITSNSAMNAELWRAAGYTSIPDIAEMVHELVAYQEATD
jgi:dTDP-4-dehydrorhamnose reductase